MNIRDLQYILAVDEQKSFVKAALKCNVSQPALSMQIQKIEQFLGVQIFERARRNIITTSEGKKAIFLMKNILMQYDGLRKLKFEMNELRIGIIPTISPYLLPKVISGLQKEFEGIKLFFLENKTADLMGMLEDGTIDVAIMASDAEAVRRANNIASELLYKEEFLACLPARYKTKEGDTVSPAELKRAVCENGMILLEEGNCMLDDMKGVCASYKALPTEAGASFYTASIETIKQMIKLGNGMSILPRLSCTHEDGLKYLNLPKRESREVSLIYRKGAAKMTLVSRLHSCIAPSVQAFL